MRIPFQTLLGLIVCLAGVNAHALVPAELALLKPGITLEMPEADSDLDKLQTLNVLNVGNFVDPDGARWFRVDGKNEDGQAGTLFLHVEKDTLAIESALARMKLKDIGSGPKMIMKFDKMGQGELSYDGATYKFNADESDDAKYTSTKSGEAAVDVSYYRFENTEDDDLSLLVLEWGEAEFEVLQTGWIDASRVKIK